MQYYFKSYYTQCKYSQGWYGVLDYAPPADVLLYDDNNCFCLGKIDEIIDGIEYISGEEYWDIVNTINLNDPNVWYGERLVNRWVEVVPYG